MITKDVNAYNRDYYRRKPSRKDYLRARSKEAEDRNRRHILQYLLSHPCVDCGESDPLVLEFDHVRGDKKWEVTSLGMTRCSLANLQAEIDKCDVRCVNCHRKKTFRERGTFRAREMDRIAV